jgi:dTMP kinase
MFYTFEGLDGCGKTTQVKLLENYFKSLGKEVITLREPGGTAFTEQIRELLLNKDLELTAESELFLFEASRSYLTKNIIEPALKQGKIVICDRFYDSTVAYQVYGRGLDAQFVNKCNETATYGVIPNVTFYLKIDLSLRNERLKERNKDRIEKSGEEFFEKVKFGFDEISNSHNRIKVIDGSLSIDEIHKEILSLINS